MTSLSFAQPPLPLRWPAWREHGAALASAIALHAGLAYLLFNLSQPVELPPVPAAVIQTQLVELPKPAPAPSPMPEAAAPTAVAEPSPVVQPEPVAPAPVVDEAALARKRVQQARRDQQRAEQVRREAERREQLATQQALQAKAEQARLEQQRLAQARRAEAERQAAAAARARAEADAASRQYLPIAKQAPDYPQRALDRRIEGECTVVYTVDAQGRVADPQIVGNCHPLFIKPSLAAAKRFRYQPRVVDGQAVAVANVKNTFTYRIQ